MQCKTLPLCPSASLSRCIFIPALCLSRFRAPCLQSLSPSLSRTHPAPYQADKQKQDIKLTQLQQTRRGVRLRSSEQGPLQGSQLSVSVSVSLCLSLSLSLDLSLSPSLSPSLSVCLSVCLSLSLSLTHTHTHTNTHTHLEPRQVAGGTWRALA